MTRSAAPSRREGSSACTRGTAEPRSCEYLPVTVQRRWVELLRQPQARQHVEAWARQAPQALAGVSCASDVGARIGELWSAERWDDLDAAMRVLVAAVAGSGQDAELAFHVLLRRMMPAVIGLRLDREDLDTAITTLWLVAAEYPLARRPRFIALNVARDLRKRVFAELGVGAEPRQQPEGLAHDLGAPLKRTQAAHLDRHLIEAQLDPAWIVEAGQPVQTDPLAAIELAARPATELAEGLLDWAADFMPARHVELLRLVFVTGDAQRTPLDEVAQQLGISNVAARKTLQRAIERLTMTVLAASAGQQKTVVNHAPRPTCGPYQAAAA